MPPVPKHSSERRRRNKDAEPTRAPSSGEAKPPPASRDWHPVAREWFQSLKKSGQSVFYEQSDWATAKVWAEMLSRQLESGRPSSQMMAAWHSAAQELLTTEGSRRRVRVELERVEDAGEDAQVAAIEDYRRELGA